MDAAQARALDALQPFVALSKSATSARAAAELVTRATSSSNTYVFAELLETPQIQSLRSVDAEHARYLTQLEIFAWGTWRDYHETPHLPELDHQQQNKLRLLSLVTLCRNVSNLRYKPLQAALGVSSDRALEDLVISATNIGLVTAKLSPSASTVYVSSVSSLRDVPPGSAERILDQVHRWDVRCNTVLTDIDKQVREVRRRAVERRKAEEAMQKAMERIVQGSEKMVGKRGASGDAVQSQGFDADDVDDRMDIDDGGFWIGGGEGDADSRGDVFQPPTTATPRKNARARTGGVSRR